MSRSASLEMMMALLPPSSRILRPKRPATAVATFLPIGVEPVKETNGILLSLLSRSPIGLPITTLEIPSGISLAFNTFARICWQAMAQTGVLDDGFQTHTLPHTRARAAFQLHTATGKLKAEIIPTIPMGCHCSYMRCCGRSECMVNPYSCLDKPTAKSQMSIISCTSPKPSCKLFPISYDTRVPRSSLLARRASPSWRTISPLFGAGTLRQYKKASSAVLITCS